jgi:hypothetical protein
MEKKKVIDKRTIKLENVLKKDFIPFLGGRPKRTTVINKEDIINLKIALNVSKNVEEFLKMI